jgi:hypothetical protein
MLAAAAQSKAKEGEKIEEGEQGNDVGSGGGSTARASAPAR